MEENKKNTTKKKTTNNINTKTKTTKKSTTKASASKKTSTKKVTTKSAPKSSAQAKKKETPAVVKEEVIKEQVVEEKELKASNKTELKRLYIMLGFIGTLVLIGIISAIVSVGNSAKTLSKVEELKTSLKEELIYITKTGCSYCELNENNMSALKEEYGIDYYEVNISNLTKNDVSKLVNLLELDADDFGTPTMSIIKNGEVIRNLSGIQTYDNLYNVLKDNNLIKEDTKLYLNYIDLDEYKTIVNSKTPEVVVLASSTCYYCLQERPILDEIAKETGAKINWIYLDRAFSSEEEYNEFMSSLEWLEENSDFGTPTTLVIKNGKVEGALSGYREKSDIITFYTQNSIIK